MIQEEGRRSFNRNIVSVDGHPRIYIIPSSRKEEPSEKANNLKDARRGDKEGSPSFFGHHIGKLLTTGQAERDQFSSIDKALESGLEIVRKKLQRTGAVRTLKGESLSKEEIKHQHFIDERNVAQETLFEEIVRTHCEFGTELKNEDLWSLHDSMRKEAKREVACSPEEPFHEHVEYQVLSFLRRRATEQAWQKLEDYMARVHMSIPVPPSMLDPKEPERNEWIGEERKKAARDELMKMPAEQLGELILGNVPAWVYSYPAKDSYLWQLTVLQGVAAGLSADLLVKYLAIWESNSSDIIEKIENEFVEDISRIRKRAEEATDVSEAFSVSMELQRISREEIPDYIWKYVSSRL